MPLFPFSTSLSHEDLVRLAETLLHFLWQGTTLAGLSLLVDRLSRSTSAESRYLFQVVILAIMLACLPVTWCVLNGRAVLTRSPQPVAHWAGSPPVGVLPSRQDFFVDQELVRSSAPATSDISRPARHPEPASFLWRIEATLHHAAPYLAGAYLIGLLGMCGRLAAGFAGERRLRHEIRPVTTQELLAGLARQASRLGLGRIPDIAWCERISVPLVTGLIRPLILLPTSLASGLTLAEIESLLAHELAHVRRFDLWVNLVQRLAEALLFFHPAVWTVSRRISGERENCCDDLVLQAGWGRTVYAHALLRMAELAIAPGFSRLDAPSLLAATGTGPSEFKRRILRLLDQEECRGLRLARSSGLAMAAIAVAGIMAVSRLHSATEPVTGTAERRADTQPAETPAATSQADQEWPPVPPGRFRVVFQDAPWHEVLTWYGRVLGTEIDLGVVPPGTFRYDSPRPFDVSQIIQLLKTELLRQGYYFRTQGQRLSLHPADDLASLYERALREDLRKRSGLPADADTEDADFQIIESRLVTTSQPPAPQGPAIAFVLQANRDFTTKEATAFWRSCIFENSLTSLTTGQPIVVDGFAVLHQGTWHGTQVPALKRGDRLEIWRNEFQEWNARAPADLRLAIAGRLVGENGQPVPGRVRQFLLEGVAEGANADLGRFLNWAYGGEAVVDRDGRFPILLRHQTQFVRKAYLYVFAPGYAPQRVGPLALGYEKPTLPLTIRMQPGFTGTLRLVLPDGRPLPEGEVEILTQDDLQADGLPVARLPVGAAPLPIPHCPTGPLLLKVRVPGYSEQTIRDVQLSAEEITEVKVNIHYPPTAGLLRGAQALERIQALKPAWGPARHGIEFGIAHAGNQRRFRAGERVPLILFVRNNGDQPVKVEFGCDFLWYVPDVHDDRGRAVPVPQVFAAGTVAVLHETLPPGAAFGLEHPGLGIGANPHPGKNWNPAWETPVPGTYTLRHEHIITSSRLDDEVSRYAERYSSASIEFQVLD